MSSDIFRRVGRGGAGNFYSKKDIDEVQQGLPEDIEAQEPDEPVLDPPSTANSSIDAGSTYARAGRGGAGNFYDRETAAEKTEEERMEAEKAKAVVASNLAAKPRAGLSGRGGVGNWTDSDANDASTEEERKKARELEARILQDVNAGLPPPPRTYQQHDREMER